MGLDISWTSLCLRPVTPCASDTSIPPDRLDDEKLWWWWWKSWIWWWWQRQPHMYSWWWYCLSWAYYTCDDLILLFCHSDDGILVKIVLCWLWLNHDLYLQGMADCKSETVITEVMLIAINQKVFIRQRQQAVCRPHNFTSSCCIAAAGKRWRFRRQESGKTDLGERQIVIKKCHLPDSLKISPPDSGNRWSISNIVCVWGGDGVWGAYILKTGFRRFRNPQKTLNFPQKCCLRTRIRELEPSLPFYS